jgi:Flp pilus assembly protein TadG
MPAAEVTKPKASLRFRKPSSAVTIVHRSIVLALERDESGVVAVLTALALTVLIGIVGLAIDVGMWYRTDRALQNAADAAVIAAALNSGASYQSEAKAVAAKYGFVDGANGITVTASNNQTCPGGATDCYLVTIAQASPPQFFSPVVGNFAPSLAGSAMAGASQTHSYCLLALASSGTDPAILGNGSPFADLSNCSLMSNTGATCHGHNLNATYGDAHGTNNGCGITELSNVATVADPYYALHTHIPSNPCGSTASSFPQEDKHGGGLSGNNVWGQKNKTTSMVLGDPPTVANHGIVCGDLQLAGNVTLTTASPGSLLVIENGRLDLNGNTLQTASRAGLTIIFSGPAVAGQSYTHSPTGGGTLDIQAPTSGTWSGIAMYQDPALTSGVDITYAGNSPTWNITGVVYLPHASVTFKGAVNKSSNGQSCFELVVDNITIDGTGSILAHGGCAAAGVTLPTNNVGGVALLK